MNGEDLEGSGRELVDVPCDIYLEGLSKATKASVRRASVPTSLERYHYTDLLHFNRDSVCFL
jgi:hypothetical protein